MIITRTPLRISYVGGGTDFRDYFKINGGAVVSTTINKYVYVTVNPKFDERIHFRYSKVESVDNIDELNHMIGREALRMEDIEKGIEIVVISDVPAHGTGLGTSSSLSVGLLKALRKYKGQDISKEEQAEKAATLEIDILKSPIGIQDQYASSFGGFNLIYFSDVGDVCVRNLNQAYSKKIAWLNEVTMLFYLKDISEDKDRHFEHGINIDERILSLDRQKKLVNDFITWMCREWKENDAEIVGQFVTNSWKYKKQVNPQATTDYIDSVIESALRLGATGAKLCGAGGKGFLMVICDKEKQQHLTRFIGASEMKFNFETEGAKIIYED